MSDYTGLSGGFAGAPSAGLGPPGMMGGAPATSTPQPPPPNAMAGPDDTKMVNRDVPDVPDQRRKLVKRWNDRVLRAKKKWETSFRRMRENQEFCHGRQWPDIPQDEKIRDDRYVANICIRHVTQRTAELYPNNPKMRAKQAPRLLATTWDGTGQALLQAQQQLMTAVQTGMPPDPQSMMILQDAQRIQAFDQLMDRVGRTLEILYDYNIREQTNPFKDCMKMTIRRGIVAGVGYIKLGFQRAMHLSPEVQQRIADFSERLANIERLSADLADGEIQPESADVEALKVAIQTLMAEPQIVVREGLSFDYPDSTAIIPDTKCRSLKGFVGADWVAQEYLLTPDQIEEVYMVDVTTAYTAYDENGFSSGYEPAASLDHYGAGGGDDSDVGQPRACIWEIYHRKDGTVYTVCDGYPDFLTEPAPPEAETTRFWPWFAVVFNEGYDEKRLFPQSDIDLIRDMQLELNRSRQGLREQRRANRPKMAVAAGLLEEPDLDKLRTHPANALLELNALAPGQKIEDVLQAVKMPPIDPAAYDTSSVFEDVLRVLGSDQADQGTTSDATATEVSVAQFSQTTDTTSVIDDLNDILSQMASAASEILVLNVQQETVQKVVGPGAVWPQLDRQSVADNVFLEVDEGSNGPANRQQDVQALVQLVPLLQRIPGISPEWLARQLIRRMGDDIDITEAFADGLPSMEALNQLMGRPAPASAPGAAPGGPGAPPGGPGAAAGPGGPPAPSGAGKGPPRPPGPGMDPAAQGPVGATNAMQGPSTAGSLGPRVPPLQVYGANGNRPGMGGGPARIPARSQGMPTP